MSQEETPVEPQKTEVTDGNVTQVDPDGTFLTGVEVDMDQWRAETVEELTNWLDNIKNKKTEFGDPLVEFPEGWDKDVNLTTNQQIDLISSGLAKSLTGNEAREAQQDLQSIRAQADKLRQLDKQLNSFKSDSEDEKEPLSKEDEDLLDEDIVIPEIDVSGPNPFEMSDDQMKRLKEIDEQLGFKDEEEKEPTKTMAELNDELLKLYTQQASAQAQANAEENEPKTPQSATNPKSPPVPSKGLKSAPSVPPISMKPTSIASRPIPPLAQADVPKPVPKRSITKK